ncbi:MAG: AEC family transporter [Gammaproteobacteria bacterium]|nr:AEC family transporter [Rhodocyclaceae bacterium]MBU3910666.1 AEC family transporter [Gammaproteobacteria bacterium]MBU3989909.1 AEC family transporter [Gammaproteobacteria bacterium]MBU4005128.1 AEC family transporter [Gammaproteobacteria bacterium]MBU4021020.1 AEC family transporter [Gammaproteobacteria bacterium]
MPENRWLSPSPAECAVLSSFFHHFALSSPLFLLVLIGYGVARSGQWPQSAAEALSRFAYAIAIPAMLFRMMSDVSKMPPVDIRLLLAFFGGCLIVFIIGRVVAATVFHLDGVAQSVFALGGVFSNNVMLGVAIAKTTLGDASLASVSMVIVFNALILWTLVTLSVEWARYGEFSLRGFGKTLKGVMTNPIVASIMAGTAWGFTALALPAFIDVPLAMLGQTAVPLSLIALGMSLAAYSIRDGIAQSLAITAIKLVVQPLVVWLLARALGLPPLETQVVTLLAALAMGINVYMMSQQFRTMQGPVAAGLVLTTLLSAFTAPLVLALVS